MNIVLISVAEGQFPVVYIVMSAAAPGFGRLSRAHTLADRRQWVPWHPCWLKKTAIPALCTVPGAVQRAGEAVLGVGRHPALPPEGANVATGTSEGRRKRPLRTHESAFAIVKTRDGIRIDGIQ